MNEDKMVERKIEEPKQEVVTIDMYAQDPRRYGSAIVESTQGLPESVKNLDEISLRQMSNYTQEKICEYTGLSTLSNKVVSFINSGAYTDKYLNRVFGSRFVTKVKKSKNGIEKGMDTDIEEEEKEIKYFIRDQREYAKIEIDALQNWTSKGLDTFYEEYMQFMYGKLTKGFVDRSLMAGYVGAKNENTKLKYLKLIMDSLGMGKNTNTAVQVNVYKDGGGKELNQEIISVSGNDTFDLGIGNE